VAEISAVFAFYVCAQRLAKIVHSAFHKHAVGAKSDRKACVHRRDVGRVGNVHLQFVGFVLYYGIGVADFYFKSRRTFDFDFGQCAAVKGNGRVFFNAGTSDQTAKVHADIADADLVAADDVFLFLLSRLVALPGKDFSEGDDAVLWRDCGKPAFRKYDFSRDVGQGEDAGGVHEQKPDRIEFLEAFYLSLDYQNSRDGNGRFSGRAGNRLIKDNDFRRRRIGFSPAAVAALGEPVDFVAGLFFHFGNGDRNSDGNRLVCDCQHDVECGNVVIRRVSQIDDAFIDQLLHFLNGEAGGCNFGNYNFIKSQLGDFQFLRGAVSIRVGGGNRDRIQRVFIEGNIQVERPSLLIINDLLGTPSRAGYRNRDVCARRACGQKNEDAE